MKLNLCCGPNLFPGWVNVDKFDQSDYLRHLREAGDVVRSWPAAQAELALYVQSGAPLEFQQHDVRDGIMVADDSVDLIYVGQAIEHFNRRNEAPAFLRECARVLKPGGVIRLTTPDLNILVDAFRHGRMHLFTSEQPAFYADALPEDRLAYLMFGAAGPDCTAESYEGHFHCYTSQSLSALLVECELEPRVPGGKFGECVDCGMSHSFAVEAVKL